MKKLPISRDAWLIIIVFLVSRAIIYLFGIRMDFEALFRNWQYLDAKTLKDHLLEGIWYDHTQPPVFNLFLGLVVKIAGVHARTAFVLILKAISLANALLLLTILSRTLPTPAMPAGRPSRLPLAITLFYLLSPASIIFEHELFYTIFISFLLLLSCLSLTSFRRGIRWTNTCGFLLPLLTVSMTRSLYHLAWLFVITAALILFHRKKPAVKRLAAGSLLTLLLAGAWYFHNYKLFGAFSSSTWMGMNLARNVFHDATITDSSDIAAIEPFSRISAYRSFLTSADTTRYGSLPLADLHEEMKNDSFINEKHIGYIAVSNLYMAACRRQFSRHPAGYLKNVVQSGIIFFAPATRYSVMEPEVRKIKYYDLLYSFNLSHFAKGKQARRIALTLSAVPKFIIYLLIFTWWTRRILKTRRIDDLTLFLFAVIGYVFCVSSLFEHYENMRFRYEVEPLFLILAAATIDSVQHRLSARRHK
jgi:hypothetical protein